MFAIIQKRYIYFILSGLLVFLSIAGLMVFGLRQNIDFTGGSLLEFGFTGERPSLDEMQSTLNGLNLGSVSVQPTEEKAYIIKLRYINDAEHQQVLSSLRERFETEETKVLENRIETIGPAISSQLKERSWTAGIAVVIAIILYVAYAFRKISKPVQSWKYGVVAIIALIHDVMVTVGVFTVLGRLYGVEVGIPFVVALLTILGYSVNDTIVVFDRVRETLIRRAHDSFEDIVNYSVNSTLHRSFNTAFTTLLGLFGLYIFGNDSVRYFALALIVGIIAGTYSSIFLASPLLVVWQKWSKS